MSRSSNQRRVTRPTVAIVLVASAVAHAAIVAVVDVRSPTALAAVRARPERMARPWEFTCDADAILAAGAAVAGCASPFVADLGACADDAATALIAARELCTTPRELEVAFVDVDQLDLTPVPLLADVAPTDDIVAAQLLEDEVARKLEEAAQPLESRAAPGQVVELTRPEVELAPDQARYVSEFDSKVAKQTVARGSTDEMVARPRPREAAVAEAATESPPEATPPPADGEAGRPGDSGPSMLAMRGDAASPERARDVARSGSPGLLTGAELSAIDGDQARRGAGGELAPASGGSGGGQDGGDGGEGGDGGDGQRPELRPTSEVLERAVGGGSVDHLEDAETGDFTALNSRKWKFATFFNRMKRQVAQNWHPDEVYLRRDPSGNVYGTKDRITVLLVSLTPSGEVAKVYVAQQSGVGFLDDEAIRAFREAQPFPNPPSGLIDARSNTITFSFGFHFQIGGDRSKWRVFRYQ